MASRTLLQIVQDFCAERALRVPSSVIGSTDKQVLQLLGLLQAFCRDMVTREAFQHNIVEATHTTLAAEDQGYIDNIATSGFEGILLGTVWNRTQMVPLMGGVPPDVWQARQAMDFAGPYHQFRLRGNKLLMNPAPEAGQIIAFEYFSSWFVRAADSSPLPRRAQASVGRWILTIATLGDELPLAYLSWAWPKAKGFAYAEDFAAYERLVDKKLARNRSAQVVNMAGSERRAEPGIVVPEGSWSVS